MKIYVVETLGDYTEQCGFSSSKVIAEKKAKELNEKNPRYHYWVKAYTEGKNGYVEFDGE